MDVEDDAVLREEIGVNKKGLSRIVIGAGLILLFGWTGYNILNEPKISMDNPLRIERTEVRKGEEDYKIPASRIAERYSCLFKQGDLNALENYIQDVLNKGRPPTQGGKINTPIYPPCK